MINNLWLKVKPILIYGVFGIITTIINIVVYAGCYELLNISNMASNVVAWILAVVFAFVTNKIWVFESKCRTPEIVLNELVKFMTCRVATGAIDLFIMFIGVDVFRKNALIIKILSNVIVIVLNYLASKIYIFRSDEE